MCRHTAKHRLLLERHVKPIERNRSILAHSEQLFISSVVSGAAEPDIQSRPEERGEKKRDVRHRERWSISQRQPQSTLQHYCDCGRLYDRGCGCDIDWPKKGKVIARQSLISFSAHSPALWTYSPGGLIPIPA